MADYSKEEIKRIEDKWRDKWKERNVYQVIEDTSKPKYYVLDMFPYPSGAGLHVGHPLGYIASDIVARFKRLKGFNVLHPMGFDAFGLPAEQYAIEHGVHPAKSTQENILNFKNQLDKIGFCYDWSREVQTCDPKYYKWTQWIFLQIFDSWYNRKSNKAEHLTTLISIFESEGNGEYPFQNSKFKLPNGEVTFIPTEWKAFNEKLRQEILMQYRLAYLAYTDVNWCEALGTVLANDEVINGVSYRGGFPVVKKQMRQWSLRITEYAERLLSGLEQIDFSDSMKEIQRNWIGKSGGAVVEFRLTPSDLTPSPSPEERGDAQNNFSATSSEVHAQDFVFTTDEKTWDALKENARDHRKNPTEAEDNLWQAIRNKNTGFKFRRQHAIGQFIADFACLEKKLVIEVDGAIHENQKREDKERELIIKDEGFDVIRFTNDEVLNNISGVLHKIKEALTSPSLLERGSGGEVIKVFTTRPDTIFGVDFMVLAPEHELVKRITTKEHIEEVGNYLKYVESRSEIERMAEVKKITGCFTGAYAINPFNKKQIPVWISEYVLAGYGTGAIMAVPCGDERDFKFAKHFNIPITNIIGSHFNGTDANPTKDAILENSDFLNGMVMHKAIDVVISKIEEEEIGKRQINYKMRDAGWSRQRYWGEPFPVVYRDDVPYAMNETELPLTLPDTDNFKSSGNGEGPLANLKEWIHFSLNAKRDSNTMPTHAGAAWYFLRYMDPHNDKEFANRKTLDYWNQVDVYIGGSEHAVAHLLYSRLWTKILHDLGYLNFDEPFKKLINQGKITGTSQLIYFSGTNSGDTISTIMSSNTYFVPGENGLKGLSFEDDIVAFYSKDCVDDYYRRNPGKSLEGIGEMHVHISMVESEKLDLLKFVEWRTDFSNAIFFCSNGYFKDKVFFPYNSKDADYVFTTKSVVEKMSKSKYNVVNPDEIIESYGADTLRLYEMFLGPLEASKPWSTSGIDGVYKFLRRFWNLFHDNLGNWNVVDAEPTKAELKALHKVIKKVEYDVEHFSFNTSVSEFMICANELSSLKCNKRAILESLTIVLASYAPHITEELWEKLGHADSIINATYPIFKEEYLKENDFEYPISINGKVRAKMNFALDMPIADMEKIVLASEAVQKWTEGKVPKKVIIVPGKIVNIVL